MDDDELQNYAHNKLSLVLPPTTVEFADVGWIHTEEGPVDQDFQIVLLKTSLLEYAKLSLKASPIMWMILFGIGVFILMFCCVIWIQGCRKKQSDIQRAPLIKPG